MTQPRRLAATSIARRVADEMRTAVGGVVGFQIGMQAQFDPARTRLLFCTTGILLRRLVTGGARALAEFTHVILDEMHEMDLDMGFVLTILKRLLNDAPSVKLILMSATVNAGEKSCAFTQKSRRDLLSNAFCVFSKDCRILRRLTT
eukprot:SAG11_NODE_570_length_8454_cov_19.886655_10_plen_147_part_00